MKQALYFVLSFLISVILATGVFVLFSGFYPWQFDINLRISACLLIVAFTFILEAYRDHDRN